MNMQKVRSFTGAFGLAIVVLNWVMFPLYFVGGNGIVLTRVFLDLLECTCFLVFAVGLRSLICRARSDYEWVGTLTMVACIALSTVTLVAASLEGGTALDTMGGKADPIVVRALTEGTILIYLSIGCLLIALFSAAAAYATLGTGILPKWTAWIAYATAILNLVAVPLGFSTAAAAIIAVVIIADFPLQIWVLIVSILMMRSPETRAKVIHKQELEEVL